MVRCFYYIQHRTVIPIKKKRNTSENVEFDYTDFKNHPLFNGEKKFPPNYEIYITMKTS